MLMSVHVVPVTYIHMYIYDPPYGQFIGEVPKETWIEDHEYYFIRNQKQGYNMIFNGYMYKKEANYSSTINWICSDGNGKRVHQNKCVARAITKDEGGIKLGKNDHNHPPRFVCDNVPKKLITKDMLMFTKSDLRKHTRQTK
ncbi:uncharacterized protein pre-mod(mdg4)-K [Drosophila tropicalis]|uniref:uncharacterized protein pre-mod(mdg4)-K n=1 Tax=Drosophila tropicalis TaxID=46794 RepID=UPI0035ABC81E